MSIQITTDVSKLTDAEYGVLLAFMNDLRQLRREAFAKLETVVHAHTHISDDDRPDTGAPEEPSPSAVFGQAGNGAPAFAGAATSTTALGASAGTSISSSDQSQVAAPPAPPAGTVAAGTGNPVGVVETDKHGLPWDSRIHAESRAKNADQSWRRRRLVNDEYVATIEAELRAVMGNGAPVASPVAPAPTSTPAASQTVVAVPPPPSTAPDAATLAAPAAPAPEANNAGNAPPAPPPPPGPTSSNAPPSASVGGNPDSVPSAQTLTFPQLCGMIVVALGSKALTNETVSAVLAKHNLAALPTLASFPNLVPVVAIELGLAK